MSTKPENSYKFFQNRDCKFFPCHKDGDPETFSCLFCYCPLYALGDKCGGNYKVFRGICKDCSDCLVPHKAENYDYIISKYDGIMELAMANISDENKEKHKA